MHFKTSNKMYETSAPAKDWRSQKQEQTRAERWDIRMHRWRDIEADVLRDTKLCQLTCYNDENLLILALNFCFLLWGPILKSLCSYCVCFTFFALEFIIEMVTLWMFYLLKQN